MQKGDAAGTEVITRVGAASKPSVQFYGKSSRDESENMGGATFEALLRKDDLHSEDFFLPRIAAEFKKKHSLSPKVDTNT